ncbi:hypothetical protein [Rhizobium sp. SG2393]|uniref:hypothetical protein n=1 Tax=Rhizobium sp. SG2393 TaxID=3276279 RepID=UPI00366C8839
MAAQKENRSIDATDADAHREEDLDLPDQRDRAKHADQLDKRGDDQACHDMKLDRCGNSARCIEMRGKVVTKPGGGQKEERRDENLVKDGGGFVAEPPRGQADQRGKDDCRCVGA